jgi:uncharacterized protein YoxC
MNQTIEVNIADVLSRLESKIDHLTNDVNEVKIDLAKLDQKVNSLETNLNVKYSSLETSLNDKFSGLDKRLGNIEFVARSIAGGIIIALLLAFTRYLFPNVTL